MALHPVRVIRVATIINHPNADALDIIPIPGTMWQTVSQKGTFRVGDLAVYIEPDMVVPTTDPAFVWLDKNGFREPHRMKAVRLRGEYSYGLLIPAPVAYFLDGDAPNTGHVTQEGDDLAGLYGIKRWEPPMTGADALQAPWPAAIPKLEVESIANHPDILVKGEGVIITEKIHGTSARYLYQDGVFYIGSRVRWLDPKASNFWTRAARYSAIPPKDPVPGTIEKVWEDTFGGYGIEAWCRDHEGVTLYGEIYGPVMSLKYGEKLPTFRAFSAWKAPGEWFFPLDLQRYNVLTVPLVYAGPWNPVLLDKYAETDTDLPGAPKGHMMEGLVITAWPERNDPNIGRVMLKYISKRYWLGKHA